MLFPYRNDLRKTLIPYLKSLPKEDWFKQFGDSGKSVAWIIGHIASSEDYWVHHIGNKSTCILSTEISSPSEILDAYQTIRLSTDEVLLSLSEQDLDRLIEVPVFSDGWVPPSPPTWRWLFHHVYTHEAYHTGQIAVIARLNGFSPPHF